jgi:hypothetical protein
MDLEVEFCSGQPLGIDGVEVLMELEAITVGSMGKRADDRSTQSGHLDIRVDRWRPSEAPLRAVEMPILG